MFTTVAFSESIATAATWTKLAAVPDQHIKTAGDSIYVSQYNRLIGGYACLDTLALGARLVSPSIRRLAPVEITPLTLGLLPITPIQTDIDQNKSIILEIDEQLEAEFYGTPTNTVQNGIAVWLADSEIQPAKGQIYSVRATITLALVAGTWSFSNMTFAEDLPVGTYDIVGFDIVAGEGMIARLVPVGAMNRPGVPVRQLVSNTIYNNKFRFGNMGVFCSFPHNNVPSVEVFALTDETSETYQCIVDIIKK
jgi:hypothetical protein